MNEPKFEDTAPIEIPKGIPSFEDTAPAPPVTVNKGFNQFMKNNSAGNLNAADEFIDTYENPYFITRLNDDEKKYLKLFHKTNKTDMKEVKKFADIMSGGEGKGEGNSKYYFDQDKEGRIVPIQLKNGERPPAGKDVESIWGNDISANDDIGLTTVAKNIFNTGANFMQHVAQLGDLTQGLITGEESKWFKTVSNYLDEVKLKTKESSNQPFVEGIEGYEDFFKAKNWNFTPDNLAGNISQLASSVFEMTMGAGLLKTAGMGAKAGLAVSEAEKAGVAVNAATKAKALSPYFLASYSTNLSEGLDAAKAAGLHNRDGYAVAALATIPVSLIEMNLGIAPKLLGLNSPEALVKKKLVQSLVKGFAESGEKFTEKTAKDFFEKSMLASSGIFSKMASGAVINAAEEGTEEFLQNITNKSFQQIYDKMFADGKEVGKGKYGVDITSPQALQDYVNDFIGGALGGGVFGASYKEAREKKQSTNAYRAVKEGKAEELKLNIAAALKNGDIDQDQANFANMRVDHYQDYFEKTKDAKLDDKSRKRVFDLTWHNGDIQTEIDRLKAKKNNGPGDAILDIQIAQKEGFIKNNLAEVKELIAKADVKQQPVVSKKDEAAAAPEEKKKEADAKPAEPIVVKKESPKVEAPLPTEKDEPSQNFKPARAEAPKDEEEKTQSPKVDPAEFDLNEQKRTSARESGEVSKLKRKNVLDEFDIDDTTSTSAADIQFKRNAQAKNATSIKGGMLYQANDTTVVKRTDKDGTVYEEEIPVKEKTIAAHDLVDKHNNKYVLAVQEPYTSSAPPKEGKASKKQIYGSTYLVRLNSDGTYHSHTMYYAEISKNGGLMYDDLAETKKRLGLKPIAAKVNKVASDANKLAENANKLPENAKSEPLPVNKVPHSALPQAMAKLSSTKTGTTRNKKNVIVEIPGANGQMGVQFEHKGEMHIARIASSSSKIQQSMDKKGKVSGEFIGKHAADASAFAGEGTTLKLIKVGQKDRTGNPWNAEGKIVDKNGIPYGDKIEVWNYDGTYFIGNLQQTNFKESPNKPKAKKPAVKKKTLPEKIKHAEQQTLKFIDDVYSGKKANSFFIPVTVLPKWVYIGAVKAGFATITAGYTAAIALKDAMQWIKDNHLADWNKLNKKEQVQAKESLRKLIKEKVKEEVKDWKKAVKNIKQGTTDAEQANRAKNLFAVTKEYLAEKTKFAFTFSTDSTARKNFRKLKIRKHYENILGFKNIDALEAALTRFFKANPTITVDHEKKLAALNKTADQKTRNIIEHLRDNLSLANIVELKNFFSSQIPIVASTVYGKRNYKTKSLEYVSKIANLHFEEDMTDLAKETLEKFTQGEFDSIRSSYVKKRNTLAPNKKAQFELDKVFLQEITGIDSKLWDNYVKADSWKNYHAKEVRQGSSKINPDFEKYKEEILFQFIIRINDKTTESPIEQIKKKILTSQRGAGSAINTIRRNTPIEEKLNYIRPNFKNAVWNLKDSYELASHLSTMMNAIGSDKVQSAEYLKDNKFVKSYKGKKAIIYANTGIANASNKAMVDEAAMSERDVMFIAAKEYQDGIESGKYKQVIGQFGDKSALYFVEAPAYTDLNKLKKMYKEKLERQVAEDSNITDKKEFVAAQIKQLEQDTNTIQVHFAKEKNPVLASELFTYNFAYNFNEINEYLKGKQQQYSEKYKGNSIAIIKDSIKRASAEKSNGEILDTNIKGGVGETHNLLVVQLPKVKYTNPVTNKEETLSPWDGQSMMTRKFSDKLQISSGSRNLNTIVKAMTSGIVDDKGNRLLEKSSTATIDELAEAYPKSFWADMLKMIEKIENDHGIIIDKITTTDGAKKMAGKQSLEWGTEFNPETHLITVDNSNYYIQQEGLNNGRFEEGEVPIQVRKNEIPNPGSEEIQSNYNQIIASDIAKITERVLSKPEDELRKMLIADLENQVKIGEDEKISDDTEEEETEEKFIPANKVDILNKLKDGVPLNHLQIRKWLLTFLSNKISKTLERKTNKARYVPVAYMPSDDFQLEEMQIVDGKVRLPRIAISELSGLRAPGKNAFKNKKDLITHLNQNKKRYADMFDVDGNVLEQEIEDTNLGFIIPGEYVKITRVPADAPHSHPVARVKYLLPKESGNIMVTPHGIQHIAGEDFDGDMRHVESFFKEKITDEKTGKKKSIYQSTGDYGIANEAFKKSIEWYYKPESYKTIYEAIDKEKGFGPILEKLENKEQYAKDSPVTFIKMRTSYNVGLKVVGIMAKMQGVYDYMWKLGIDLKSAPTFPVLTLSDNGKAEFTGSRKGNMIYDARIKNKYGNLLNLALDNGNELKIESLGLNEVTANMYCALIFMGNSIESISAFFNQPYIKHVVSLMRATKNVDSKEKSKYEILNKLKDELDENATWKSVPLISTDINSTTKEAKLNLLKKLYQLDQVANDFSTVQRFIKAGEEAPKSFTEYYFQRESVAKVLYGNKMDGTELKFIDTTPFKKSVFSEPQLNQNEASRMSIGRFSIMSNNLPSKILSTIEAYKRDKSTFDQTRLVGGFPEAKRTQRIDRNSLAILTKAIENILLIQARGVNTSLEELEKKVTGMIQKAQDGSGKYSKLWNLFQVVEEKNEAGAVIGKALELREDLKTADISDSEMKEYRDMFDEIYFDDKYRENAKTIVDYAAVKYNLATSTFGGAYTILFSNQIHAEIANQIKDIEAAWNAGNVTHTPSDYAKLIISQNPELQFDENITELQKEKKLKRYSYQVQKDYRFPESRNIKIEAKQERTLSNIQSKAALLIAENNPAFEALTQAYSGDTVTVNFNGKKHTAIIQKTQIIKPNSLNSFDIIGVAEDTGYTETELEKTTGRYVLVALKPESKEAQQQKESDAVLDTEKTRQEKLATLKKALPKIEVKTDTTIKGVAELSADGKTVSYNPNYNYSDTAIHEFGHALIDILGGLTNKFINRGVDQLKDTPLWDKVKSRYPELSDEMLAKEVLATAIGQEGALIWSSQEKKSTFRNWLELLWLKLKAALGIEKNVARNLAGQLLSGIKLSNKTVATKTVQQSRLGARENLTVLQNAAKEFVFDEKRHEYSWKGEHMDSTTERMNLNDELKFTGENKSEFEKTSELGKGTHSILEHLIKNDLSKDELKDLALNGKKDENGNWIQEPFATEEGFELIFNALNEKVTALATQGILGSELVIGNTAHGICGTSDVPRFKHDGTVDIFDLKTSINSTKDKKYTTAFNGKKSKKEKHGIQLGTYAKIIEIGDPHTGASPMTIDNLAIMPLWIKIEKVKQPDGTIRELINYAELEPDINFRYDLVKEDVDVITMVDSNAGLPIFESRIRDWMQYARESGYRIDVKNARKEELRNKKVDGTITDVEQKELNKLYKDEKKYKSLFKKYKLEVSHLYEIEIAEGDLNAKSVEELEKLLENLKKFDYLARLPYVEKVQRAHGFKMAQKQVEFLQDKNPDFIPEEHHSDISRFDIYMRLLSDFSEKYPAMQYLFRTFAKHKEKALEKQAQLVIEGKRLFQELVDEYNEKNGITQRLINWGKEDLSVYQKNIVELDAKQNPVFKSLQDPTLTKAEKNMIEFFIKTKMKAQNEHERQGGIYDEMSIIKETPKLRESMLNYGLFRGYIRATGSDRSINQVKVYFHEPGKPKVGKGKLMTIDEIKDRLDDLSQGKIIDKLKAAALMTFYSTKAKNLLKKETGQNEDGSKIAQSSGALFTLNKNGKIISGKIYTKTKGAYSTDYYTALMNYATEMIYAEEMQEVIPVFESIEAMYRNLKDQGEKVDNLEKYLEIWKKGNITGEKIDNIPLWIDWSMYILRNFSRMMVMAGSVTLPIFNFATGRYNQFREQRAKDFLLGDKRLVESFKKAKGNIDSKDAKAFNVIHRFRFTGFNLNTKPKSGLSDFFNNLMYGMQKFSEEWVRGSSALALINEEHYSWMNDEGKTVVDGMTLDEIEAALSKAGISEKEKSKLEKNKIEIEKRDSILSEMAQDIFKRIDSVQGAYSDVDRRNFMHSEIGLFLGQYRIWIPDMIISRFGKRKINARGEKVEGSITTLKNEFNEFRNTVAADGWRQAWIDLHSKNFWDDSLEGKNMRKNLKEMISFSFVLCAGLSFGDDDEKKQARLLNKFLAEITSAYSLNTFEGIIKQPAAGLVPLEKLFMLTHDAYALKQYKHDSKYHDKGDYKAFSDIWQLTPYHRVVDDPKRLIFDEN